MLPAFTSVGACTAASPLCATSGTETANRIARSRIGTDFIMDRPRLMIHAGLRLRANPHRFLVRLRHCLWLPSLKKVSLRELRAEQRMLLEFFERQPFRENLAIGHRQ